MDSNDSPLNMVEDVAAGDVDYHMRLSQLRQFISGHSLTKEEYRYIKILLSRVNTDIISELPIELVEQISELLDLSDFVTCLAVSKRWRDKFLSTPIINSITDRFHPSLRQMSKGTPLDPNECLKILHTIGRLRQPRLESTLEKSFSWQYESYFKLDPDYHGHHEDTSAAYAQFDCQFDHEQDPSAHGTALYSNGKIAWRPSPRIIVVDNLWSRTRKVFTSPHGPLVHPDCKLRALGDRLVIASVDRLLIAWDHTTNICLEKKLPRYMKGVTTKGLRVAITTFNRDVFLWEFGGQLSMLSTTPITDHHNFNNEFIKCWEYNLYVIFHPACDGKLFLASGYTDTSNSKSIVKRMVYEFDNTNHVATFEFEIPSKASRKEDTFSIIQIRKGMPYCRDIIGFRGVYWKEGPETSTRVTDNLVEFDIYDRKFFDRTDEESDTSRKFGWFSKRRQGDMDFLLRFHDRGFTAYSPQPGFDFGIGE
ncbi:hypothetical protein F4805DRAFT_351141 [Annulohypoxylon moriforme]|nr:hypothetical protein F4805DRAFT_351141 [Annulohypoxylon moriforme]